MTDPHVTAPSGGMVEPHASTTEPWPGDDFPAWLSPMLVRELRQGIQSGAFFWTFLAMQAALFVVAAVTLLAVSERPGPMISRGTGSFFWAILGLTVGLVIPLRAMTAIASERAGNNLDLIQLTRLSATRIVVGKWAAIVAQAMLVAVAALPYLVLQYFFGGVNVVDDLRSFAWLLVGSALVAAFAVLASTRPQRERVGLLLLVGVVAWVTLVTRFAPMAPSIGFSLGWLAVAVPLIYIALLLEAAASSIAPPAENHALRKRLIGLFCAAVIAVAGLFGSAAQLASTVIVMGIPLLVISVAALLERPVPIRRIHTPFARAGFAGKALAAVFTPGWATAVVYVGLVGGMTAGAVIVQAETAGRLQAALPFVTLSMAAILFPLPVLLLFPKVEARGTLYVMIQIVGLVPWIIESIRSEMMSPRAPGSVGLIMAFPLAGLLHLMGRVDANVQLTLFIAGLLITAGIIALIARPWRREISKTWRLVGGETPP